MQSLATTLEDLTLFPDWESRYGYIIDLAKSLPPMPDEEKTEATKVRGCTSQVWLTHSWNDDKLSLHLDSDALIVKGLLALAYIAFNGQTAQAIRTTDLNTLLTPTNLLQNLSPNRRNGFASVLQRIRQLGDTAR